MSEYEIRMECLRLATLFGMPHCVEIARQYYDFVLGKSDAEKLKAAKEFAAKMNE